MDVRSPAVRPPRPTTTTTPGGPKEEVRRFSRPLDFWRTPPPPSVSPPACPPTAETPVVTPSPSPSICPRRNGRLEARGSGTRSRGRGRGVRADATPPRHQHKAIREMGFDSDPPPQPTPTQTPSAPPSLQSKAHFPQELPARKRTYTKMYKDVCLEYIYMKHETRKGKF